MGSSEIQSEIVLKHFVSTLQPSSDHTLPHPSMDDNYDSSRNSAVLD